MKIHFGHRVGKYDPSAELPRNFYAGIGPLQLGVVLVVVLFSKLNVKLCIVFSRSAQCHCQRKGNLNP